MPISKPSAALLAEWERTLTKLGLHMNAGLDHGGKLIYVENTDIYQTTKRTAGSTGGRVRKYGMGDAVSHHSLCETCGRRFVSKRADAKSCSPACRKARSRKMSQIITANIEAVSSAAPDTMSQIISANIEEQN